MEQDVENVTPEPSDSGTVARIRKSWGQARTVTRLYYVGAGVLGLSALIFRIFGPSTTCAVLAYLGGTVTASGFVAEVYQVGLKLWETVPGKLLGALLITMVGALAMGLSSVIVNYVTGLEPSSFPYTVTFLAPLTAGFLLLMATFVVAIVGLLAILGAGIVTSLPLSSQSARERRKQFDSHLLFRMLGWLSFIFLVAVTWDMGYRRYEAMLETTASTFAFNLEMYRDPRCSGSQERTRRVNDSLVAVGRMTSGGLRVELRACPLQSGVIGGAPQSDPH